ncbi:MAG: hypothetical protein PVG65_05415 [Candidatus Thorarchaeota archaeon]|jgi:hypothetical protein
MKQENYYVERKEQLLEEYSNMSEFVKSVLSVKFSRSERDIYCDKSRQEFENLLPQIPFIDGKENRLTRNLMASAMMLELYRTLKNQGMVDKDIGKIAYEIAQEQVKSKDRLLLFILSKLRFSRLFKWILRRISSKSQERLYPEDWVLSIEEGDGADLILE